MTKHEQILFPCQSRVRSFKGRAELSVCDIGAPPYQSPIADVFSLKSEGLDWLRFYPYLLTMEEIKQLMNSSHKVPSCVDELKKPIVYRLNFRQKYESFALPTHRQYFLTFDGDKLSRCEGSCHQQTPGKPYICSKCLISNTKGYCRGGNFTCQIGAMCTPLFDSKANFAIKQGILPTAVPDEKDYCVEAKLTLDNKSFPDISKYQKCYNRIYLALASVVPTCHLNAKTCTAETKSASTGTCPSYFPVNESVPQSIGEIQNETFFLNVEPENVTSPLKVSRMTLLVPELTVKSCEELSETVKYSALEKKGVGNVRDNPCGPGFVTSYKLCRPCPRHTFRDPDGPNMCDLCPPVRPYTLRDASISLQCVSQDRFQDSHLFHLNQNPLSNFPLLSWAHLFTEATFVPFYPHVKPEYMAAFMNEETKNEVDAHLLFLLCFSVFLLITWCACLLWIVYGSSITIGSMVLTAIKNKSNEWKKTRLERETDMIIKGEEEKVVKVYEKKKTTHLPVLLSRKERVELYRGSEFFLFHGKKIKLYQKWYPEEDEEEDEDEEELDEDEDDETDSSEATTSESESSDDEMENDDES